MYPCNTYRCSAPLPDTSSLASNAPSPHTMRINGFISHQLLLLLRLRGLVLTSTQLMYPFLRNNFSNSYKLTTPRLMVVGWVS